MYYLPEGTWYNSARNIIIDGNMLKAELQNELGVWVPAYIEIYKDKKQILENKNGKFQESLVFDINTIKNNINRCVDIGGCWMPN